MNGQSNVYCMVFISNLNRELTAYVKPNPLSQAKRKKVLLDRGRHLVMVKCEMRQTKNNIYREIGRIFGNLMLVIIH